MPVKSKDKSLVGAAGEHLVLSRLLARDLLASQAPGESAMAKYQPECSYQELLTRKYSGLL